MNITFRALLQVDKKFIGNGSSTVQIDIQCFIIKQHSKRAFTVINFICHQIEVGNGMIDRSKCSCKVNFF